MFGTRKLGKTSAQRKAMLRQQQAQAAEDEESSISLEEALGN